MKCPADNEVLLMIERSGVEIDFCPKCRGVWLDRGELDKIIERSAREDAARLPSLGSAPSPAGGRERAFDPEEADTRRMARRRAERDDDFDDDDDDRPGQRGGRRRRGDGFLSEIFDFF